MEQDKIYEAYKKVMVKSGIGKPIKVDGRDYFVKADNNYITITHEQTKKEFLFGIDDIAELIIKKFNIAHKVKKGKK